MDDVIQPMSRLQPFKTSPIIADKVGQPESFQELADHLHAIFSDDVINVDQVKELMTQFKCNPKEYRKYAKFNPHRYTRNLVDAGNGKFNLMMLCWNEGQGSSIHAHADAHCFMKIVEGCAQEELYDWPADGDEIEMTPKAVTVAKSGDVMYINDSLGLHRIENPSHSERLITLHVYSPPYSESSTFDQRTGRAMPGRVTYWSEYGKRTAWSKVETAMYGHTLSTK